MQTQLISYSYQGSSFFIRCRGQRLKTPSAWPNVHVLWQSVIKKTHADWVHARRINRRADEERGSPRQRRRGLLTSNRPTWGQALVHWTWQMHRHQRREVNMPSCYSLCVCLWVCVPVVLVVEVVDNGGADAGHAPLAVVPSSCDDRQMRLTQTLLTFCPET